MLSPALRFIVDCCPDISLCSLHVTCDDDYDEDAYACLLQWENLVRRPGIRRPPEKSRGASTNFQEPGPLFLLKLTVFWKIPAVSD